MAANLDFESRHIGPSETGERSMLAALGVASRAELIDKVVPEGIRKRDGLNLAPAKSEPEVLAELTALAHKNDVVTSLIGQGYYDTHTPAVILRNVFENPGWYTSYTPYQPEISQGRLEALLNFQTMVSDLTGLPVANASLLDEATAAAEAMTLCQRKAKSKAKAFFVSDACFDQTIDVVKTRAEPLGIEVIVGNTETDLDPAAVFGALLQYPDAFGDVKLLEPTIDALHAAGAMAAVATDLLALTLFKSPGAQGADIALGSAQRFGVPLGFGGPHAAFFATSDAVKRSIPGRLIGVSVDANGDAAYRLSLQTREQHIRREKATSNICTAQALLAIMAGFYGAYHGPEGLSHIAGRIRGLTAVLKAGLEKAGLVVRTGEHFDTLVIEADVSLIEKARAQKINLRRAGEGLVGLSLDETSTSELVETLLALFGAEDADVEPSKIAPELVRDDAFMEHPVFHRHRSETAMMRYMRTLMDKDLALDRTMIPLGSCTMKLNAAVEMMPVSLPGFGKIHPFAPVEQVQGYLDMITELERDLAEVTGYAAVSLQPNSGAQGEYAGLLCIRDYHAARGEGHRNICLIPSSAHGTNPASANMAGMKVVVVKCDDDGNVDMDDLTAKVEKHSADLAALMVTYPSTHGVFEDTIRQICDLIHKHGGQVYVDGANLNALIGLVSLGEVGADVSHLNLHKTFCIPHGGGGPGVGPIGVRAHLAPYLPGHRTMPDGMGGSGAAVSAAAFGSASILPISLSYMKLMGAEGLTNASETAILNANYIAKRLAPHYPVLYTGQNGLVAHECIIDTRPLAKTAGISVDDIAKRLIDFGFHAPTMSWPVAGTLMIEPTESENKQELDRFCDAMIAIRHEIAAVENGDLPGDDNPLVHAPHTAEVVAADEWTHAYPRSQAAYPAGRHVAKYWPPVGRVDNAAGDRNLVCSCPPLEAYEQQAAE